MAANPFENFNPKAQEVLTLSYQLLMQSRHNQLDVEHILMALLDHRNGVLPQVLELNTIAIAPIRQAVQDKLDTMPKMTQPGPNASPNVSIFITPDVQRLFGESDAERRRQGADTVGPEHILLAMVSLADRPAALLLKRFGLDRQKVLDTLPKVDFTRPTSVDGEESDAPERQFARKVHG